MNLIPKQKKLHHRENPTNGKPVFVTARKGKRKTTKASAKIQTVTSSSNLSTQQLDHLLLYLTVDEVDLTLGQCVLHVSVHDTVAVTGALSLGVHKLIHQEHLLGQVPRHIANNVIEIIGRIGVGCRGWKPEGQVVDALWVYTDRLQQKAEKKQH